MRGVQKYLCKEALSSKRGFEDEPELSSYEKRMKYWKGPHDWGVKGEISTVPAEGRPTKEPRRQPARVVGCSL